MSSGYFKYNIQLTARSADVEPPGAEKPAYLYAVYFAAAVVLNF